MTCENDWTSEGWMTAREAAEVSGVDVSEFVHALDVSGKAVIAAYPHEYDGGGWLGVTRLAGHESFEIHVTPVPPVSYGRTVLITHVVRAGLEAWAASDLARDCRRNPSRQQEACVRGDLLSVSLAYDEW